MLILRRMFLLLLETLWLFNCSEWSENALDRLIITRWPNSRFEFQWMTLRYGAAWENQWHYLPYVYYKAARVHNTCLYPRAAIDSKYDCSVTFGISPQASNRKLDRQKVGVITAGKTALLENQNPQGYERNSEYLLLSSGLPVYM